MDSIKRIVIVQHRFGLTTAKTQRMLAASKIYINNGVEVFFVYSTERKMEQPELMCPEINFVKIQEGGRFDIKSYMRFVMTIKSLYTKDSAILFYEIPNYAILFRSPKYRVFAEVTEVPLFGRKGSLFKRFLIHFTVIAARHFSGLFVISRSLALYYRERGVMNIEVINMFVDKSRFDGCQKKNEVKYVGYCGTLSLYKDGVDDLISAFSIFNKKFPEYKLYLIGSFESAEVEKELKDLVENNGVADKVIFTGLVASNEMPQLLLDAEMLALSRPNNVQAQYGFPTKLGEYLATGNPVIVTSVGEIPEFLYDGDNALLCEPGNIEQFALKLEWVVTHKEESRKIGMRGLSLVEKEFSAMVQTRKALQYMNNSL